ncbi:nuclear transport factor 2 family protein [candidate division KSB1 bacterium]|nr:nuclear transport factor 2 family protein [candidate division KSB1 bacterium]
MNKYHITIPLAFLILLMCSPAEKKFESELQALADAELAFAQVSATSGMREAFLTYLANDAVVLQPALVNGHEAYKDSPEVPGILQWRPVQNAVSFDGTLGFSTGPWEWRPKGNGDEPTRFGHFISLWKKQHSGEWRVVFDGGIHYAEPSTEHAIKEIQKQPPEAGMNNTSDIGLSTLEDKYNQLINDRGYSNAVASFADSTTRFYHSGHFPALGHAPQETTSTENRNKWIFEPVFSEMASSNDFGYSYGYIHVGENKQACSYLHIYRKDKAQKWRLAAELVVKIPK